MAAFLCKCGNRLSNTLVPNNIVYHVYSDVEWDKILEKDILQTIDIPAPEFDVWKCNSCERVYVFDDAGKVLIVYIVEK